MDHSKPFERTILERVAAVREVEGRPWEKGSTDGQTRQFSVAPSLNGPARTPAPQHYAPLGTNSVSGVGPP